MFSSHGDNRNPPQIFLELVGDSTTTLWETQYKLFANTDFHFLHICGSQVSTVPDTKGVFAKSEEP